MPFRHCKYNKFLRENSSFSRVFLHRARRKPLREHLFKIPHATNQVNRASVHACSSSLNGDLAPMEQHRLSDLVLVDYPFITLSPLLRHHHRWKVPFQTFPHIASVGCRSNSYSFRTVRTRFYRPMRHVFRLSSIYRLRTSTEPRKMARIR